MNDFDAAIFAAMKPGVPYTPGNLRFHSGGRWRTESIKRALRRMEKSGDVVVRDGRAMRPCPN